MTATPESRPSADLSHAQGPLVGDYGTVNNYFGGAPRGWPALVGVLPPLADCRQPREQEQALAQTADAGGTVVLTQVLSGMGGVGKTQIAAAHAHRLWNTRQVDLLVWVSAVSREAIVAGYAQAADRTGVSAGTTGEQAAQRFLGFLAETDRRWLIVLDDLTLPADLAGWWPPASTTGATIVTTRVRSNALARAGLRVVDVGLFTVEQARQYAAAKLVRHPTLADDIDGLTADLGRLPIALAQAAAYIVDEQIGCREYRRRFADRHVPLQQMVPPPGFLPDSQQATVDATWMLSIDRADALTPVGLARPVLQLANLLDPNGIPLDVLTAPAALAWYTQARAEAGHTDTGPADAAAVRAAIGTLHRLQLADRDTTHQRLRVHALVQRATQEHTPDPVLDSAAVAAADALIQAWPAIERDPILGQALRANTTILHTLRPDPLWTTTDGAHHVLFKAGSSLGEIGHVAAAADYYQQLHHAASERLGPDHPHTLATRDDLAGWRGEAGDPAGAAAAAEELLADVLRVLGPDHPHTLTTRGNLAYWRGAAGDPAGAAAAAEELLADQLRVLGPDHPHTLATHANLASWRGAAGDPAGAAAAFEELLADHLRVLGPEHPDTLTARHSLAYWRGAAGDPAGAVAAMQELLADVLRVLGPDHPDTLATRGNLASWRGEAGDPAGAAAAYEELLADYLRVLGPDHPSTLTTRNNLAYWQERAEA